VEIGRIARGSAGRTVEPLAGIVIAGLRTDSEVELLLFEGCRIPGTLETSTALQDSQLAERAADTCEIATADLFLSLLQWTIQSVRT